MQNYDGLIWLLIPLVFIVLVALLMMRPRSSEASTKRGFYVLIAVGIAIIAGYYIIRIFIIPP